MAKAGRPKHEPTAETRKTVQDYSAVGIPQDDIALSLGIDKKTLAKHYKSELKLGAIKANATVAGRLFAMTKTVPAAAIFWTKTRMGWREKERPIEKDEAERPLVFKRGETRKSQRETEEKSEPKNGTDG